MIEALQNVIINTDDVQQNEDMNKMKGLLEKYGIKEIKQLKGDDKRFGIKIRDDRYADGFKSIKAKTKEEVFSKLEKYDREKDIENSSPTFKQWFSVWKERQSVGKKRDHGTIEKYRTDYARVFEGTDFEKRPIDEMESEEIENFMLERCKARKIPRKACSNINCIIRGMFKYAKIKRIVTENVCDFVDWEMIVAQCDEKVKDESWKAIDETDSKRFDMAVSEKISRDPDSLVPYCAMFVSLTGVRAGEAVAITLDNINEKYINIDTSEKTIQNKGQKTIYYIGPTKNKKKRTIPMTEDLALLINKVLEIRQRTNSDSKFLFCRKNGNTEWVSTPQVRDWLRRNNCKCMQAMRATLSAQLKKQGVSPYIVSSLLGHSVRVNAVNYSPNIISLEEKRAALSKNNRKTV